ncbi:MAG TPA: DUF167 domain-containing protein [Pyrinomonadaceae bacterium]|nr:DUF167 domain-containing protein [Pyrinomonadaceae bacterium]
MIKCSVKDGKVIFSVHVVPRASRSEIVGEHNGALRVRIAAAPVDGAANIELIRVLAIKLNLPRSAVEITSGHSSKLKRVSVAGQSARVLERLVTTD